MWNIICVDLNIVRFQYFICIGQNIVIYDNIRFFPLRMQDSSTWCRIFNPHREWMKILHNCCLGVCRGKTHGNIVLTVMFGNFCKFQ